ncbi:hypothetical protein F4804DRAFT_147837 [Jackrogersella minutella]|nr:hypothetical protein F4804DRAFT_147837 [Jackrogersella minutella]
MPEKSPEVLATANLTPVSPAPLYISSPVVIPTLQDQADNLYTMSLPNGGQVSAAPVSAAAAAENQLSNGVATTNAQNNDSFSTDASSSQAGLGDGNGSNEEDGAALVKDEGNVNAQHPSQQNGGAEAQQDVSKTKASALNSDASENLTDHSEATASFHDIISFTTPAEFVHQPIQNSIRSSPQEAQEPKEPQEQAVVISSTNSVDAPQPPTETPTETRDPLPSATNGDIDIQSLVDKIIGDSSAGAANRASAPQTSANAPSVSLPPRPPMPQQPTQPHARLDDALNFQPTLSFPYATAVSSALPPPPGTYPAGAPGTSLDARNNLPPPPASSLSVMPAHQFPTAQFDPTYVTATAVQSQTTEQSQQWETFLQEERRYVSEAKWDRFPEGSRLFIGNLSSDRVSKKEVFDLFSKYGRLAQISLKQAYGFVQYHTLAEGQAAMDHLQGIDVRGRKIHLEFSRTQKKDGDGDKRGGKIKRDNDRHEGGRNRRDDYRPNRQPSPRRETHRPQNSYDSGRSYYDDYGARGRSRSPSYGRRDSGPGHYRRRSPSPYHRQPSEVELDIPRRYGGDIPDVQFLLLQEVERDFVSWVERSFLDQGLKVQVMFLHPHFPREAVIQRQVMEGVYAVVELDYRSQQSGTISLQVFNRSSGRDNVRYDQYQDLNPSIAAQLVGRVKSQVQVHTQPPYVVQYPPAQYAQAPQHAYPPPSYPSHAYPSAPVPPPMGKAGSSLDNATLQQILGNLQNQQGSSQGYPTGRGPVDMNSLLAGVGGSNPANTAGPSRHYSPRSASGLPGPPSGDSTQHVQNIMAQLARYRQ